MNTRVMVLVVGMGVSLGACSSWPRWHGQPAQGMQGAPPAQVAPQPSKALPKPQPTPSKPQATKKPTTIGEAPRPVASAEKKREQSQSESRRAAQPQTDQQTRTERPKEERLSAPSPTPMQATPKASEYPYASPVPGKAGFVTSPYAPYAGQVDVQGLAPGSEARDPYTGKIFRVP